MINEMLGAPKVKGCGQGDLADDGLRSWDEQIKGDLDGDHPGWQNPQKTTMVPPFFSFKGQNPDEGQHTEKNFYDLLQEFGETSGQGMFVVHSHKFREKISELNEEWGKEEQKWLTGEHDFVVIHRQRGIIFFQVKAASKTKGKYAAASKQLEKDKEALRAFAGEYLPGKLKNCVDKELFVYPGFVVMPNCPRPDSAHIPSNGIFKEDCESVETFSAWWKENIVRQGTISQEVFNCLVMRFIGVIHSGHCLSHSIDKSHKVLFFKTNEQLKVMLGSTSEQWITGPAGSGKTWILMAKVKCIAQKAILHESGQKILVVCDSLPLSKMLAKTFEDHLTKLLQGGDLSSVVKVRTFSSLLFDITEKWNENDQKKRENIDAAVELLEKGMPSHLQQYDHIFVDECQDLIGNRWPELFQKLWKNDDDLSDDANHKWFFYDTNQHMRLSEEQCQLHKTALKKSTKLTRVLRNTGNVFDQSKKYFKSIVQTGEDITLGHKEPGLAIKWDISLPNRQVPESDGAESVVKHIEELRRNKVHDKDICVLVDNKNMRDKLSSELKRLNVDNQDAEKPYEEKRDKVVVESIRRFKGLESKVVILYNPRFFVDRDWPVKKVRELLYTAVSRCSCYLIVITTKRGDRVLRSDEGVVEGALKRRRQERPRKNETKQKTKFAKLRGSRR